MYEIEKGVPLANKRGPTIYPLDGLGVGDSFRIPAADKAAARAIQQRLQGSFYAQRPKKFATRQVEGGLRVWRTK